MKNKTSLLAACAVLGMAASAMAQGTVINITGATAFRQAAHASIIAALDAGSVTYGYAGTSIASASHAIFHGTINGGADEVTVRTSWSGSVQGIDSVVNAKSVSYINTSTIGTLTSGGLSGMSTTSLQATTANYITFADNIQDNTPFDAVTLDGFPVGVIAFIPVVNDVPDALIEEGDNITTLQLRRLITTGVAPLQFITGQADDAGVKVYWTGRQDTSGTRVIYLTETGLGASRSTQQHKILPTGSGDTIATDVQIWPLNDVIVGGRDNRSILWGPDTVGNGGYNSGGDLQAVMKRTSAAVNILDENGNITASNQNVVLLTVLSVQEGEAIQLGGGKVLAYNGVYIEPETLINGGLSDVDRDKIIKGQYTLWSKENLLFRDDIAEQPIQDFIPLLQAAIPANIGGNGVPMTQMRVNRTTDGGSVVPLGSLL